MKNLFYSLALLLLTALPAHAAGAGEIVDLTRSGLGIFALVLFVVAYGVVIMEERLHLRKSKPVIVAAGIIWVLVASFPAALGGGVLQPAINSLITKSAKKDEVGGILGVSSGFYSAANAITPLFFGSLFQWFGAPVPFMAGGVVLLVLWFVLSRAVPKT